MLPLTFGLTPSTSEPDKSRHAHDQPERALRSFWLCCEPACACGQVIIAGAGGAAHLPGMVAAMTPLPVIGVPVTPKGAHLDGLDALMSIVQVRLWFRECLSRS